MKRILNLNDISGPVLTVILILGLGLPAGLFLLHHGLESVGLHLPLLEQMMWFLLAAGGLLLLLFFLLVALELLQDEVLYRRYLRDRGTTAAGECPFCGNRQIHAFTHICPVCGEKIHHNG